MNSPKILLMPLGMGGEVEERLHGALSVAKKLGAHLRILYTSVSPQSVIPSELAFMSQKAVEGLHDAFEQHVGVEEQRLKALFHQACEALSIPVVDEVTEEGPSASWLEERGLRSGLVAQFGKVVDMTILARPSSGRPTASFEAAVLETGRPLLLIPRTLEQFSLDMVMVAWNCSAESSRSLMLSLPLLQMAKQVIIVSKGSCAERNPGPQAICDYLAAHQVTASAKVLPRGKQVYKGETLLACAREHNADLVVMGAYSKKRFQESVFGGVTQYMLAHADMPLFLSH
ncbi:MAG: universal stress protein [Sedimenticola sp.]